MPSSRHRPVIDDKKCFDPGALSELEGAGKIVEPAYWQAQKVKSQSATPRLRRADHAEQAWIISLVENADLRGRWHDLVQQFKAFRPELVEHEIHSGDVSARTGDAGNEPGFDRVGNPHNDDRDLRCGPLGGQSGGRVDCDDDLHMARQKVVRHAGKTVAV